MLGGGGGGSSLPAGSRSGPGIKVIGLIRCRDIIQKKRKVEKD